MASLAVILSTADLAERCASIGCRYECEGELADIDLGIIEVVGAQIGVAILQVIPEPKALTPTAERGRWGSSSVGSGDCTCFSSSWA